MKLWMRVLLLSMCMAGGLTACSKSENSDPTLSGEMQTVQEKANQGDATAQIALARGLAETTSGTNVTVNSILPGPTLSEGVEKFIADLAAQNKISKAKQEELFFQDYRPSSLIKRFLAVEEVANMVAYICSPLAAGTNGAALRVEGGLLRSIV